MNTKLETALRILGAILLIYLLIKLFSSEHLSATDRVLSIVCDIVILLANYNLLREAWKKMFSKA